MITARFAHLSDRDLLGEVVTLANHERAATAQLVAALAEVDARRLYLGQGCSSLFTYCTQVPRLSEHAAYDRIEAARASRRFPRLLDALASGELTLTAIGLLAPVLTDTNYHDVLAQATHKSKREVEEIVAALRPRADVRRSCGNCPSRDSRRRWRVRPTRRRVPTRHARLRWTRHRHRSRRRGRRWRRWRRAVTSFRSRSTAQRMISCAASRH
jgi:hypothetical protein